MQVNFVECLGADSATIGDENSKRFTTTTKNELSKWRQKVSGGEREGVKGNGQGVAVEENASTFFIEQLRLSDATRTVPPPAFPT